MSTGARRFAGLIGFFAAYTKANLQMAMEYRASFFIQVGGMVLNDAIWVFFWWIFFSRFEEVAGWGVQEVMLLFAVLTMGFGIGAGLFGNALRLSHLIAEGHLDYYLVLPKPPLFHLLISRTHTTAWGDVIFGLLVYLASGHVSWRSFLTLLVAGVLTAALFISFFVIVHSLAFWLGHSEGLSGQLCEALIAFGGYPEAIFNGTVKVLLFTLIPAGFISAAPVRLITSFDGWYLAFFTGFVALLIAIATTLFRRGVQRYESGNIVSLRL